MRLHNDFCAHNLKGLNTFSSFNIKLTQLHHLQLYIIIHTRLERPLHNRAGNTKRIMLFWYKSQLFKSQIFYQRFSLPLQKVSEKWKCVFHWPSAQYCRSGCTFFFCYWCLELSPRITNYSLLYSQESAT